MLCAWLMPEQACRQQRQTPASLVQSGYVTRGRGRACLDPADDRAGVADVTIDARRINGTDFPPAAHDVGDARDLSEVFRVAAP